MADLVGLNNQLPKITGNQANNQINKRNEPVSYDKTPLGSQLNSQNMNRFKRELDESSDYETIENTQENSLNSNLTTLAPVILLNNSENETNKIEETSTKKFNKNDSSSSDGLLKILAKKIKYSKDDDKLLNNKFVEDSSVAWPSLGDNDSDKTIYETFNELLGINQSNLNEMEI